jgi:hypothetical protein
MKRRLAILVGIIFLTACGGGGGGGGDTPSTGVVYTGATGPAAITATNALDLALGAYYGGPVLNTLGIVSPNSLNQNLPTTADPRLLKFTLPILKNLPLQTPDETATPSPMAIVPLTETFPGNCGGTQVISLNVDDNTGSFNGTMEYNNYCEDATTISGTVNISGGVDLFTFDLLQMSASFSSITFTSGTESATLSGNYTMTPQTMTLNHRVRDNATGKTYKIENYVVTETEGFDWTETTLSSGSYFHPDYGYVTLSTIVPFRLYWSDFGPVTGQLQITGANGSHALLTSISTTLYEVTADTDGNGTYEWSSGPLKWSDVNTVPVAATGSDQYVTTGTTVQLDGSSSVDADADTLTYSWTLLSQPAGSSATLFAPQTVNPSFVPDLDGTYVVTLIVNDGTINSAADQLIVTAQKDIVLLNYKVSDAEYSKALDRLIVVSASPTNQLHILDPLTGADTAVSLPLAPSSVSVSPDGLFAAVGHNAWVTYVNLSTASLVKTFAVSTDVVDIVLAGNGYVYAFPRVNQWETIRCVNVATETETLSTGMQIYAGTLAKLHPNGTSIYGADNGLSPSDIEKYDISGGTASYLYDSPYHGDYAMCGDLWIAEDGMRIFTRCGNVFTSSNAQAGDMLYNGSLGVTVKHLSHSTAANKVIAIPQTPDTQLQLYGYDFLSFDSSVPLPIIPLNGLTYPVHGKYVFFSAAGTHYYAIVQADANTGMLNDFGVIVY